MKTRDITNRSDGGWRQFCASVPKRTEKKERKKYRENESVERSGGVFQRPQPESEISKMIDVVTLWDARTNAKLTTESHFILLLLHLLNDLRHSLEQVRNQANVRHLENWGLGILKKANSVRESTL